MTKKSAKALIAFRLKTDKALEVCLKKLNEQERQSAEAYWAGHIQSIISGTAYGAREFQRAEELLDEDFLTSHGTL